MITALVQQYLGPRRRAGQSTLPSATPMGVRLQLSGAPVFNEQREDVIFRDAGFDGPERLEVPGRVVDRTAEEVVASVFSLSSAAPHLFGDRLDAFERDLRQLLQEASPDGRFSERMGSIGLSIWR